MELTSNEVIASFELVMEIVVPELLTAWFPALFLTSFIIIGYLDRTFKFGLLRLLILGPDTLFDASAGRPLDLDL